MTFERYVAVGDSTTEGLDDPDGHGGYRGWADRLAERLAEHSPRLRYANLAVRGLTTAKIRAGQLDRALALRPDLATVVAGTNDVLRPRFDPAAYARELEAMVGPLRASGATVLSFTLPDLTPVMPLAIALRGRVLALNAAVRDVCARTGATLVDLAAYAVTSDPRLWSDDRLHANAQGHARIAEALAQALGVPGATSGWQTALPEAPPRGLSGALRAELAWARGHFAPWALRHLLGRSSGDGRLAKRPELTPVLPAEPARPKRARKGSEARAALK